MPLTDADITKVQKACEAALKNNTLVTNPYRPAEEKATTSVAQMSKNVGVHGLEVRQVLATLQALADRVEVLAGAEAARDEQAAARLAEQLAPAVMGAIREELDDLPPEQLAAAVDQALRSVLTELGKPKPAAPTT